MHTGYIMLQSNKKNPLVNKSSTSHTDLMHYRAENVFLHKNKLTISNSGLQPSMLNLIIHCGRDAKTNTVNNHTSNCFLQTQNLHGPMLPARGLINTITFYLPYSG